MTYLLKTLDGLNGMLEQAGDVVETWGLRMGGGQLACGGGSGEEAS